jgi:hypothetical protein
MQHDGLPIECNDSCSRYLNSNPEVVKDQSFSSAFDGTKWQGYRYGQSKSKPSPARDLEFPLRQNSTSGFGQGLLFP